MANLLPLADLVAGQNVTIDGQERTPVSRGGRLFGYNVASAATDNTVTSNADALLNITGAASFVRSLASGSVVKELEGTRYTITFTSTEAIIYVGDGVEAGTVYFRRAFTVAP